MLHSLPVLSAGQDRRVVVDTNDLEYDSMYGEQEDYDTALDAGSLEQLAEDGELPVPHRAPGIAQVTPWCRGCLVLLGTQCTKPVPWGGHSSSTWLVQALGSPCSWMRDAGPCCALTVALCPCSRALPPAHGGGGLPAVHTALVLQPKSRRVPALRLQRLPGQSQPLRQPGGV